MLSYDTWNEYFLVCLMFYVCFVNVTRHSNIASCVPPSIESIRDYDIYIHTNNLDIEPTSGQLDIPRKLQ